MPKLQSDQVWDFTSILMWPHTTNNKNSTTYLQGVDDVHSKQQCGQQTHSDFKEKLSETMIKKHNDYKCLAPFRRRQCHCCCYPAYQSCWLIIPLWWHQFYGLWNASQCFHNAIQLGYSIHHWAGESLLIGWRADCHSPAEEGHGFWRSGHSDDGKRNEGYEGALCRGPRRDTKLHTFMYFIGMFS